MSLTQMYFMMMMTLTMVLFLLGQILPTSTPKLQKKSPYECGFDPMNSARLPISFRFFLMSLLFLLFDLEIAILMPLPFIFFSNLKNMMTIWTLIMFLTLLTMGLCYEWLKGGLDWAQ